MWYNILLCVVLAQRFMHFPENQSPDWRIIYKKLTV